MNQVNPELRLGEEYYYKLMLLEDLPSASLVLHKVTNMVDDTSTNIEKLAQVISTDQGLTTKILAVANSPFYGLSRRVSTIEYAVLVLGFEQIKQLTIALSMIDNLDTKNNANWNKQEYWYHSLLTGSIAKRIAEKINCSNSGEAFTAGIMHDIGIIIMQKFFNDDYNKIYEIIKNTKKIVIDVEEEVMGLNHADIGSFLLFKWNIPYGIYESVMNHHRPKVSQEFSMLTYIINIADSLARRISIIPFIWDKDINIDLSILDELKLDKKLCENIIDEFKDFQPLEIFV